MEDEPVAKLTVTGGGEVEMRRDNSALFTHLGELACYDHIFIQTEPAEEESETGMYIFRMNDSFYALMTFMAENKFPMHLNATSVADCDKDAFQRAVVESPADVPDYIPDDWLDQ